MVSKMFAWVEVDEEHQNPLALDQLPEARFLFRSACAPGRVPQRRQFSGSGLQGWSWPALHGFTAVS
jgi:hypothetical protein